MDDRTKALGRLYDEVKAHVKALVEEADPEGLLAMGAPSKEYDDAVGELTRHVLKGEPVDRDAVERWFGTVYGVTPAGTNDLVRELEILRLEAQNRRS